MHVAEKKFHMKYILKKYLIFQYCIFLKSSVLLKKIKKFYERVIKNKFLDYKAFNQYRVWNVKNQSIIKMIYVKFNNFINFSDIKKQ